MTLNRETKSAKSKSKKTTKKKSASAIQKGSRRRPKNNISRNSEKQMVQACDKNSGFKTLCFNNK